MKNWKEWWSFWAFTFAFAFAVAVPTAYYWGSNSDWSSERNPASVGESVFFPCHCTSSGRFGVAMYKDESVGFKEFRDKNDCRKYLITVPYCRPIGLNK